MPITLNDCLTTADLPPAAGEEADPLRREQRMRIHQHSLPHGKEAEGLVAAFLASGGRIKTYPPAYAVRSPQYRVPDPPPPAE
jgi:hypothetical protein